MAKQSKDKPAVVETAPTPLPEPPPEVAAIMNLEDPTLSPVELSRIYFIRSAAIALWGQHYSYYKNSIQTGISVWDHAKKLWDSKPKDL
jgi:hypothetical protein